VQGTELLEDQESQDDTGPAGVEEILPPLPQAYAAQRGQIDWVVEKLCNFVIERPADAIGFQFLNCQLPNYSMGAGA
jgi:hypothetical protein